VPRRTKPSAVKRRRRVGGPTSVRVTGVLAQGSAIGASEDTVTISAERIETGELVFRVAGDFLDLGLADRDLLIVEPRSDGNAATGEFVIATLHERAFLGRWWAKHGDRMVLDNDFRSVAQGPELQVLGAVTLIVRESV
jgi:SOS-response transcriptional repressor LexA